MGLFSRTLSRLDELKKVLTKDPSSRQFLALADEYRRQGRQQEAIVVLQQGLELNPAAVAGHVALGRLLQQTGRVDDAIASFQSALRLDPQNLVALRLTADLYLSKGDPVEAIKKLKLFRGLSPGDREVNELIRQLDGELVGVPAPETPVLLSSDPFAAQQGEIGARPVSKSPAPPVSAEPPPVSTGFPAPPGVPPLPTGVPEVGAETSAAPAMTAAPAVAVPAAPIAPPPVPMGSVGLAAEALPVVSDVEAATSEEPQIAVGAAPADEVGLAAEAVSTASYPEESFAAPDVPSFVPGRGVQAPVASEAPSATETLAELLRAQGHLGEAEQAYRELARTATDAVQAGRFAGIADEVSASRTGTARGRLEAWVGPFSRSRGRRLTDLVGVVEEVVERLDASAAVVTDFEGVPVVSVGPRAESEPMENLAAELTAFWKNARRSRAEIGEGTLDSLVLLGSSGAAAVKVITPGYALLLKTAPGVPAGRIRFEAARAAEQLRPSLL